MNLHPVDERVIVKPVEEAEERKVGSIIIPDTASKERPQIGEVMAVGDDVEKSNENRKKLSELVKVGDRVIHTAAEGNGPVNAHDWALRKALLEFYPDLTVIELVDYKVRILEESAGTGSLVRVLIESSDGQKQWRTMGSSTNIIEASWLALADGIEYWLLKQNKNRRRR